MLLSHGLYLWIAIVRSPAKLCVCPCRQSLWRVIRLRDGRLSENWALYLLHRLEYGVGAIVAPVVAMFKSSMRCSYGTPLLSSFYGGWWLSSGGFVAVSDRWAGTDCLCRPCSRVSTSTEHKSTELAVLAAVAEFEWLEARRKPMLGYCLVLRAHLQAASWIIYIYISQLFYIEGLRTKSSAPHPQFSFLRIRWISG